MQNRMLTNTESPQMVVNLPIESTTLNDHQKSHLHGGYITFDTIYDYISQEFGVDLSEPWYNTSNYLM